MTRAEPQHRTPALLGSLLLHGGLLAALFVAVKTAPPLHMEAEPVAVSIVSSAPNVAPALKAETVSPPRAEAAGAGLAMPEPEAAEPKPAPAAAAPAPPAPVPPPRPVPRVAPPAPAAPTPKPQAAPKAQAAPRTKPAPPKPQALDLAKLSDSLPKAQARSRPPLDLDALSRSLPAKAARQGSGSLNLDALADSLPAGRRAGNGARGPARAETAPQARQATGAATGLSGDELGALKAKLIRLWNPNCGVDGANTVIVKVQMHLSTSGALSAAPQVVSTSGSPPGVVQAAAGRATSAVVRGAPFDEISPEHLRSMNNFVFVFNGQTACGAR